MDNDIVKLHIVQEMTVNRRLIERSMRMSFKFPIFLRSVQFREALLASESRCGAALDGANPKLRKELNLTVATCTCLHLNINEYKSKPLFIGIK